MNNHPERSRSLGSWLSAVIVLVALASAGAIAQSAPGRLIRIDSGFVAIEHRGGGTALTRYDDSLARRGMIWLPDAVVADIAPGRILSLKDPGAGILLISVSGQTGLYVTPLNSGRFDSRFALTPLNVDSIPPVAVIVGRLIIPDGAGNSTEALLLAGDSALCAVTDSGRVLYAISARQLGGSIVRTLIPATVSGVILVVTRSRDGLHVLRLDGGSGSVNADQRLDTDGEAWAELCSTDRGEELVLAVASASSSAWVADAKLASAPQHYTLKGPPIGITTRLAPGGGTTPVVVLGTLPLPSLQAPGSDQVTELDYSLGSQPEELLSSGPIRILAAADSLAMFDHTFVARGSAPSVGGRGRSFIALDATRGVVVHPTGSRLVMLLPEQPWFKRQWELIAVVTGGVAIALLLILAWRRFRFLRTIYTNMVRVPGAQGVIVATRRGRVRRLNDAARRSLRIDAYIPLGRHLLEYMGGERFEQLTPLVRTLLVDGEAFSRRLEMEGEVGERVLNVQGRPMSAENGSTAGYLLLVDDVTDTLERDRLLNWASVAHHIAHEMKTPLGTVMMTAELLHDRLAGSDAGGEATRSTSRIIRQATRLREIVDDLLTIARSEALQRTPADLGLVLGSLAHDVGEHLPANIAIDVAFRIDDARCSIDVNQIIAAFRNLIDNAWQAIGEHPDGRIEITLDGTSTHLVVVVADNGPGMAPKTLARIFQPFYTERQGGSGIGTMIIKRVIEAHRGDISVKSAPGAGTMFTITLPRR